MMGEDRGAFSGRAATVDQGGNPASRVHDGFPVGGVGGPRELMHASGHRFPPRWLI